MSEVARRLRIHGRVQGVCFRAWSVETAQRLGLSGWVRNRTDGTVEMLVHGRESGVREMIASARMGPPAAIVERIDVEEDERPTSAGFTSRPTV